MESYMKKMVKKLLTNFAELKLGLQKCEFEFFVQFRLRRSINWVSYSDFGFRGFKFDFRTQFRL